MLDNLDSWLEKGQIANPGAKKKIQLTPAKSVEHRLMSSTCQC